MHLVRLGEILENAVRLAGRDVTLNSIPSDWKVMAAAGLNAGIRELVAEKFPMMQRIEYRRYRPDYSPDLAWVRGQECWAGGSYWRLEADVETGGPGADGSWRRLDPKEVLAFINWHQPWEQTVIDRSGIDANRFAYASDPRFNPHATPLKVVEISDLGIELQAPAPSGVFVRFIPEYPRVTFDEWTTGTEYDAGDVVYLTATKDVYLCVENVRSDTEAETNPTAQPPNAPSTEHWIPIRIPDEFFYYLMKKVAADLLQESQGKYQTQAAAESEFEKICERYHEGSGETSVRRGRFR